MMLKIKLRKKEWNNIISAYFFNPDNAGKDIHLFITKQEIINLAKENFEEVKSKLKLES